MLDVNIKLDSLWTQLETMSISLLLLLLLQYDQILRAYSQQTKVGAKTERIKE